MSDLEFIDSFTEPGVKFHENDFHVIPCKPRSLAYFLQKWHSLLPGLRKDVCDCSKEKQDRVFNLSCNRFHLLFVQVFMIIEMEICSMSSIHFIFIL